jgi:hypothetical protein
MEKQTFPALVFLTLAYCEGFVLIALALLVLRSIQKPTTTTGINAANLAPIFDDLPVAIGNRNSDRYQESNLQQGPEIDTDLRSSVA